MSIRHDYKPASTWQRRRRAVRRHGLLVITLTLIGLFGGLLAYIRGDRLQQAPPTAVAPTAAPAQPSHNPAVPAASAPAPILAPAPVKPKYDFYTELPKRQVDVRPEESNPQAAPPRSQPARPQPANEPARKPATPKPNPAAKAVMANRVTDAPKPGTRPKTATPVPGVRPPQPLAHRPTVVVKTE